VAGGGARQRDPGREGDGGVRLDGPGDLTGEVVRMGGAAGLDAAAQRQGHAEGRRGEAQGGAARSGPAGDAHVGQTFPCQGTSRLPIHRMIPSRTTATMPITMMQAMVRAVLSWVPEM